VAEVMARPDLPLTRRDDAGVVLTARVLAHDRAYGLMRVGFAGGELWVGESDADVGQSVRARVLARDVSVTARRRRKPACSTCCRCACWRCRSTSTPHC
jgi:molybdate transport system ATP-binding protein